PQRRNVSMHAVPTESSGCRDQGEEVAENRCGNQARQTNRPREDESRREDEDPCLSPDLESRVLEEPLRRENDLVEMKQSQLHTGPDRYQAGSGTAQSEAAEQRARRQTDDDEEERPRPREREHEAGPARPSRDEIDRRAG